MDEFAAAEAGRRLNELLDRALSGNEVVITSIDGRRVQLVSLEMQRPKTKRSFDAFKGKFRIDAQFFEPLPGDELANWGGTDEAGGH